MEEDGKVMHPATGTPQGGIISPILANIYLRYALDLWFEGRVQKRAGGDVTMMRFADDFVCAFQFRADAIRFEQELRERLGKFGLSVADEKTRMLQFNRRVLEPNDAFEFLGFEFRWVTRRSGKAGVRRRTSPKRLLASVRTLTEWIKMYRHMRLPQLMAMLRSKLNGYWNYYGVRGNAEMLNRFHWQCRRLLYKWLNRRSQQRSCTWEELTAMLVKFQIPSPRIVETVYQPTLL